MSKVGTRVWSLHCCQRQVWWTNASPVPLSCSGESAPVWSVTAQSVQCLLAIMISGSRHSTIPCFAVCSMWVNFQIFSFTQDYPHDKIESPSDRGCIMHIHFSLRRARGREREAGKAKFVPPIVLRKCDMTHEIYTWGLPANCSDSFLGTKGCEITYRVGRPIIRQVLKISIWVFPPVCLGSK